MAMVSRIGDPHIIDCDAKELDCPHPQQQGYCGANYPDVQVNGKAVVTIDAYGVCNCPHNGLFLVNSGSNKVFVHGVPIAISNYTTCQNINCGKTGQITQGSPNVFVGL